MASRLQPLHSVADGVQKFAFILAKKERLRGEVRFVCSVTWVK